MNYKITVIPGDGIGPEIVREAKKVMDKVGRVYGHSFGYTEVLMGGCSIDAYGIPLTEEALETARRSDAVLLGAVGGDVGNSRYVLLIFTGSWKGPVLLRRRLSETALIW